MLDNSKSMSDEFVQHSLASACNNLSEFATSFEQRGFKTKAFKFLTICHDIITETLNEADKLPKTKETIAKMSDNEEFKLNLFRQLQTTTASNIEKLQYEISVQKFRSKHRKSVRSFSFLKLLKQALDGQVEWVTVFDPLLYNHANMYELQVLLKTILHHEHYFNSIFIVTKLNQNDPHAKKTFEDMIDKFIFNGVQLGNIQLKYLIDPYLKDRRIEFSNKITISIGKVDLLYPTEGHRNSKKKKTSLL